MLVLWVFDGYNIARILATLAAGHSETLMFLYDYKSVMQHLVANSYIRMTLYFSLPYSKEQGGRA